MIKQTVSYRGAVKCVTRIPYPEEVVKQMKKAGYRVKEVEAADERKRKAAS